MTATYPTIYSLTELGLERFKQFMLDGVDGADLIEPSSDLGKAIPGLGPLIVKEFNTARDLATAVCASFGERDPQEFAGDTGLWCWLTLVLADQVFPLEDGIRNLGEHHRWYPAPPSDYQKAQRHLVRMPTLLYSTFGNIADHLLCGPPSVGSEIREQLTSQQDMLTKSFQEACRMLYFDESSGTLKRGAGSKNAPGTPRRLAAIRRQLDVTWDMTDLSAEQILLLLPQEFSKFLPQRKNGTSPDTDGR
jgi:hypothetical protein